MPSNVIDMNSEQASKMFEEFSNFRKKLQHQLKMQKEDDENLRPEKNRKSRSGKK